MTGGEPVPGGAGARLWGASACLSDVVGCTGTNMSRYGGHPARGRGMTGVLGIALHGVTEWGVMSHNRRINPR